ncbi:MAG: hydrolase [Acidobacteria bacterium]|nr:MAG: hydrolase [Acidobacteriota bacterium]
MSDTALIVIDVQESFRHRPYWNEGDVSEFVRNLQALIDGAKEKKIPIVQIFHVEDDGPFALSTGYVTTLRTLSIQPDVIFHKRYHSALVGTPLSGWLIERGIRKLIITGIRTEQCCETTTRHASDSGFQVDYVTEATLTFAMKHPKTGKMVFPEEIKDRTELVLANRFARLVSVESLLAEL